MVKAPNAAVSKVLKRLHYPLDITLTCVRWYVAYPLSLRHLEEMMSERAVSVAFDGAPVGYQVAACAR